MCHVSCVMCHVSCVTVKCHVSCVTCHVSRVTCHVSRVTCHVSRDTCHVCHVSCVTCHVSRVTCHMSRVTCVMCHVSCVMWPAPGGGWCPGGHVVMCHGVWCVMWSGVVWCGLVWSGVVLCGVVSCGLVWCVMLCFVMVYVMLCYVMLCCVMCKCGVMWCGVVVWCGVVWCECGVWSCLAHCSQEPKSHDRRENSRPPTCQKTTRGRGKTTGHHDDHEITRSRSKLMSGVARRDVLENIPLRVVNRWHFHDVFTLQCLPFVDNASSTVCAGAHGHLSYILGHWRFDDRFHCELSQEVWSVKKMHHCTWLNVFMRHQ